MPFTICCTGNTSQSEKPDGAIKNGQSRETGSTRHMTKTKENHNIKNRGWTQASMKDKQSQLSKRYPPCHSY